MTFDEAFEKHWDHCKTAGAPEELRELLKSTFALGVTAALRRTAEHTLVDHGDTENEVARKFVRASSKTLLEASTFALGVGSPLHAHQGTKQ